MIYHTIIYIVIAFVSKVTFLPYNKLQNDVFTVCNYNITFIFKKQQQYFIFN